MNVHGRFTAAVGSVALNVVLTLIFTQAAGAAIPATNGSAHDPHSYTVVLGADHPPQAPCAARLRTRAIIAVLLGLIV